MIRECGMIFDKKSKVEQLNKMEREIQELREKNREVLNKIENLRHELANVRELRAKMDPSGIGKREEQLKNETSELENQPEIRRLRQLERDAFILRGEIQFMRAKDKKFS
ncbi:MAG: hypothetical protein ACE5KA_08680 [Nitrososphaerales archaeon]